jgi:hypothetical protein
MSLLFRLPEVLVHSVLLSWVRVKDLVRLDSAVCTRTERMNFLTLVCDAKFVIQNACVYTNRGEHRVKTDLLASWAIRRHIATAELTVTCVLAENRSNRQAYLQRHGKHVRRIRIRSYLIVTNYLELFRDLCEGCPNVRIAYCEADVPPTAQSYIAAHWTQLTHLTMLVKDNRSDMISIAANCQSLVELALTSHSASAQLLPVEFFDVCAPAFQKLTFSHGRIGSAQLKALAARCPLLQELTAHSATFDSDACRVLASCCCELRCLQCPFNDRVTDLALLAIARNGILATLCVDGCRLVTDAGLQAVVAYCPLLEDVSINVCIALTDVTLIAIGQHCRNLRVLSMKSASVTHVGLTAVAAGCPLLQELWMVNCREMNPGLVAVAYGCPDLRVLDVSSAEVSPSSVYAIV